MPYPVQHPVFPIQPSPEEIETLKVQTRRILTLTPEEIETWIVAKSSFEMVACPNCEWPGGRRDRKNYWAWDEADPDRIQCTHCGAIYPHPDYPMHRIERAFDPTDQMQKFPYWEGADGYRYFLQGKIENCKKQHMERMAHALGQVYAGTSDPVYALQCARILHRLAEVYPHYHTQICRKEGSPTLLDIPSLDPPDGIQPVPGLAYLKQDHQTPTYYPYWSNRRGDGWNGWLYSEMPVNLARAYDWIASCPALDTLGGDIRQPIEDFFRATANHTRSYPMYLGNMDPSIIRAFATIGRVIGEPVFVHDALHRAKLLLDYRLFPDGNWRECAPSYHQMTATGLKRCVEESLTGYTDPNGYVDALDGLHVTNLDPLRELPLLQECLNALENMKAPVGNFVCIHDTWPPVSRGQVSVASTDQPLKTHLHWGMGHAMLGQDQVQAHLHFSGGYGHTHTDTLNLILFGHGRELLSDIGYTHTILRPFACNSLAHNLVLIDQKDQRPSGDDPPADGYLVAWAQTGPVQYCEAGGEGAYPGLASVYRRALSLVGLPGGGAYAVDIFRVQGGNKHDWTLHGDADVDQTLHTDLILRPFAGNLLSPGATFYKWSGEEGEYGKNIIDGHNNSYGLFENLRTGNGDKTWSAIFRYPNADTPLLKTTVIGQPGAQVFVGDLPSIRRAQEDSAKVYDFRMPAILVRREGEHLYSTFAAVHQPCLNVEHAVEVTSLALENAPEGAVGLMCKGEGFTDYHLYGTGADSVLKAGNIRAIGRYAFVRVDKAGRVHAMTIIDGEEVRFGNDVLKASGGGGGEVVAVRNTEAGDGENALVIDARIEPREGRPGERAIVQFGNSLTYGLSLLSIRREGDRSVLVLAHRPGFALTDQGAVQTHHPHLKSAGRPSVHVPAIGYRQ